MPTVAAEVRPPWPLRLERVGGVDGVARFADGALWRLLHVEGEAATVAVRQPARDRVTFSATAADREVAREAIARMRFATGVDDDLRPFYERFRFDPLIGRSLRADPGLRVRRRPVAFEALAWAVTEQLIEFSRAAAIQRRIVARLGRRCEATGLLDLPPPERLAGCAPAELEALDLSAGRALSLRRAAREVAAGRVDLDAPDHERGWGRLRAIPGIGRWTVEMLALHGQGRHDQVPAGDLGFIKLVGRLRSGNPRARAGEDQVRELFAAYDPWAGLAGAHLYRAVARGGVRRPGPAGTRSSAPPAAAVA